MGENSPVLWEGDEPMEQKKRIWWTFQLWEADAFGQYLEEMALKGWFLESVGGTGKRGSFDSNVKKQAGKFSAAALIGRYFIRLMMQ